MLNPRPTANGDWSFEKVFGDADFIAAGVLVIPPKARKPSKSTKDNTYVRISFTLQWTVNLTHLTIVDTDILCRRRRSKFKDP
jgi:centromere protein C